MRILLYDKEIESFYAVEAKTITLGVTEDDEDVITICVDHGQAHHHINEDDETLGDHYVTNGEYYSCTDKEAVENYESICREVVEKGYIDLSKYHFTDD